MRKRLYLLACVALLWLVCAESALAAPPIPPPEERAELVHRVAYGETLTRIAARYDTTVNAIVRVNGIVNPNLIYVGQRLVIPSAFRPPIEPVVRVHIVQFGETLSSIGRRYGVNYYVIARVNGIVNPNLIYVGQRLVIPDP